MTNALAQNIQTESNSAIDLLARATSTSSFEAQDTSSATFSNVMNNLSAKTQKTQDDFNKKANVTNTSSINKEALNKKEVNTKETNTKTIDKQTTEANNQAKEASSNIDKENTVQKKSTTEENTQVVEEKNIESEEKITKKETQTIDLSDINNSSLVDTSPVFSSDSELELNNKETVEVEIPSQEVQIPTQTTVAIVDETSTIENQDLKTKSQDLIQNIQNADENVLKVENVSANLDDSNLNQKQDETIIQEQIKTQNQEQILEVQDFEIPQEELNVEVEAPKETLEVETQEKPEISKEVVSNDEKAYEILDELNAKDFEKIDVKDKKTTDELVKILDNLENNLSEFKLDEKTTEEIKAKIEDLVKEIENKTLDNEKLEQAVEYIVDEIKPTEQKQVENQPKIQTNVVDLANKFEKPILNQNEIQNLPKEENVDFSKLKNAQDFEKLSFDEFKDFEAVNVKKANVEVNVNQDIDLAHVEENLQKTLFTQEIMEEMMVEVDIQTISSQSGALSVSDEIARLAMNETSALNPITSVHGSITYDNLGQNGIIKNVASLMNTSSVKTADTPIMEDILNQVSNRISQLKDSATQKLTMVLRPHDLGRLSIELTSNQQGLTTHIVAQNENVRAYIEKNIDSLRQQLTDAGVNVNNIQIKTAGAENSTSNYEGNQNFNKENQENFNQQNDNKNNNQQNNQNSKQMQETLASLSNYDMHFAKDFSSVLNKSLSYNLN